MPIVLGPILIGWGVFLSLLLLWALSQSGQTAIRSLFEALLGAVRSIPLLGHVFGQGIDWLVHHTVKPIADYAANNAKPIVGWFSYAAVAVERAAFSAFNTATHAYDALWKLRHVVVPRLIRGVTTPIRIVAHNGLRISAKAWHRMQAAAHTAARLAAHALHEAHVAERTATRALRHAIALPLPVPLPWIQPKVGTLTGKLEQLWRRVRALPHWLTRAGIAAVAIAALSSIGAGWLKCSNWRTTGKHVCRMPSRWLDDLIALTADFFVLRSICTVIPWLEAGFSEVATPLIDLLSRAGAGLCSGSAGPPETIVPHPLNLPAAPGVTLYLP